MRTVIVIDKNKLWDTLQAITCQSAPRLGEYVELTTQLFGNVFATGSVCNIRIDKSWPGHFLYDVILKGGK